MKPAASDDSQSVDAQGPGRREINRVVTTRSGRNKQLFELCQVTLDFSKCTRMSYDGGACNYGIHGIVMTIHWLCA